MPLPVPNSGESQDEFISRCMSNESMKEEFPDSKQRYAVCQSQHEKGFKKKSLSEVLKSAFAISCN